MPVIKAPFNFVPLSQEVVTPYWGPYINQDVPFEDGQSGTIEVSLKACSPLFVRDGKKTEERPQRFSQTGDGRYFIPGSSLKGMVRSVMEIMTFSKMKLVNDHRFAYRDFHNNHLYKVSDISKAAESGWLYKDAEGNYHIEECGVPGRIHMKELRKLSPAPKINYYSFFTKGETGFQFDANKDEHKSALFKYKQLDKPHPKIEVSHTPSDGNNKYDYRDKYRFERMADELSVTSEHTKIGTLVLTGQPDARKKGDKEKKKKPSGKVYEFVFWDPHNTIQLENSVEGEPEVIQKMKWAYLEHKNEDEQSDDWKHFKQKLNNGEKIPVFYQKEGEEVISMGLSLLYKLAYDHSVQEMINNRQRSEGLSMAEGIFGYTSKTDNGQESLKGRVHVGHAFGKGGIKEDGEKVEVLASPKASYYPIYVQQSLSRGRVDKYNTYNDRFASIAGWKRYPVRKGSPISNELSTKHKVKNLEKVATSFVPVKSGSEFTFCIQYHNLKKVELGALVSAISFHSYDKAFHSLGMAKPLGYGKVKLAIKNVDQYMEAMQSFEAFMSVTLKKDWTETAVMKELFSMVSEQENSDGLLEYMSLDDQDFAFAKKRREALPNYSKLPGVSVMTVPSLVEKEDIEKTNEIIEKEMALYEAREAPQKILSKYLEHTQGSLESELSKKKNQLIELLQRQRKKIKKELKLGQAEMEKQQARKVGPNLSSVDPQVRRAFKDSLEPVIKIYISQLHFSKEAFEEKKKSTNGLIPEAFHADIERKILEIVPHANKSDKKNWLKDFNKNNWIKVTASWIGETKARTLHEKIKDLL